VKRREFITLVGGATTQCSLGALQRLPSLHYSNACHRLDFQIMRRRAVPKYRRTPHQEEPHDRSYGLRR
jgi:hypothetical protein